MDQSSEPQPNNLLIPAAIIVAGALIASGLYFGGRDTQLAGTTSGPSTEQNKKLDGVRLVDSSDHIRGNPNAKVLIVEYSDMECPFCKRFHSTMQQIMDEYGESGQIAWVYRHFPLDSIHSKARPEAVAAECADEIGGNDAFWEFTDRFFDLTLSNNQTDITTVLPQIAREIGLDENTFYTCFASGKYDEHIQDDLDNAIATGGNGTPWSIIITESGKKFPLSGAQPYESVKQLIELALQEK